MPSTEVCGRFLLVYSSQTGQAKAIAEEISQTAPSHGLQADIHCISLTEKRFWLEREPVAVIITSTTGDGEAPDTAQKFWRRLKKKTVSRNQLENLRYALLGLGDSNYSNFCNCGKMFDKRLQDVGATQFYATGYADDAVGLEQTVEPWMEGLWPALKDVLGLPPDGTTEGVHIMDGPRQSQTDENGAIIKQSNCSKVNGYVPEIDSVSNLSVTDGSVIESSRECVNRTGVIEDITNTVDSTDAGETTSLGQSAMESTCLSDSVPCTGNKKTEDNPTVRSDSFSTVNAAPPGGQVVEDSLCHSLPPLSESALKLPLLPPPFLKMTLLPNETVDTASFELQNGCTMPSSMSDVSMVPVVMATQMTRDDAVKRALRLELDISESGWEWSAGDSFGIVCPNSDKDVNELLKRLDVVSLGDVTHKLEVLSDTKKRNASVPGHIPDKSTLRYTLRHCCGIRSPVKKALLRTLVEHTSSPNDRRRLQELCSKEGINHFSLFVREPNVNILDILHAFPSCKPSVTTVLEHLPRLQPRPYSIASSPLVHKGRVQFVFNVVDIPAGSGRSRGRTGVCTGYLDKVTKDHQCPSSGVNVQERLAALTMSNSPRIAVYLRNNHHFRAPSCLSVPVVMIGAGTGVAPFIGFLQHRQVQLNKGNESMAPGESWLFYGCRHRERDFLFRDELETFRDSGVLSQLIVAFSRDHDNGDLPRYVQDNVRIHGERLAEMLHEEAAVVYVCGDAQGMAKGVSEAIRDILHEYKGISLQDADGYIMQMRLKRRYLEDIWT